MKISEALLPKNITIKSIDKNPIDKIWTENRPLIPDGKLRIHPADYAGKSLDQKLIEIRKILVENGVRKSDLSFCFVLLCRACFLPLFVLHTIQGIAFLSHTHHTDKLTHRLTHSYTYAHRNHTKQHTSTHSRLTQIHVNIFSSTYIQTYLYKHTNIRTHTDTHRHVHTPRRTLSLVHLWTRSHGCWTYGVRTCLATLLVCPMLWSLQVRLPWLVLSFHVLAELCCAVLYYAMQCCTMPCRAVRCRAVLCWQGTIAYTTSSARTAIRMTLCSPQWTKIHTVSHSTVQYNTTQHITAQHSA